MIPVDPLGPPAPPPQATEEGAGLTPPRALGRWERVEQVLTAQNMRDARGPHVPFPWAPFSFLLCEMGRGGQ